MKKRYGYNKKGKLSHIAKIYTEDEHPIKRSETNAHALRIIKRLESNGYEAYIVGGAPRDFFLGKTPKDFDIATNAHPNKIKRLFRNARIIGKRFRIVHIATGNGNFIEVTTFRSDVDVPFNEYSTKVFGTLEQDVQRRDFTCNALYYSPTRGEIIDCKNGVTDIKKRVLIPIRKEFQEDPVRMLRALKFSVKCDLKIPFALRLSIRKNAHRIANISSSRMTEEVMKLITSGYCMSTLKLCLQYKLLEHMMPRVYAWLSNELDSQTESRVTKMLTFCAQGDYQVSKNNIRSIALSYFIRAFVCEYVQEHFKNVSAKKYHKKNAHIPNSITVMALVKAWLFPITPPNIEVSWAIEHIMREYNHKTYKKTK